MPLLEKVKANLVEWYSMAADRTEEMAKIGLRRYDKFGISRDIERQFAELGNLVYTAQNEGRSDVAGDPTFGAIVARIKELEHELARKEEEIESIKREARARKAAAGSQQSSEARAEDRAGDRQPERLIKNPPLERGGGDSAILLGNQETAAGGAARGEGRDDAVASDSSVASNGSDQEDDSDPKKD